MHGQKKRRKRTIEGDAFFGGTSLRWELVSEPQWSNSGDGYKGLCVSVQVVDETRRELLIEWPYPKDRNGKPLPVPQRPPLTQGTVEQAIEAAADSGWDPNSRDKAFVYRPAE